MENAPGFLITLATPAGRRQVRCGANEFICNAAARAVIALPAICHQGRCLTCAARLTAGEVDNSASVSYFKEDREAGFVLLCTGRPGSDVEVETHQAEAMRAWRRARGLPAPYA